MGKFINDRFLSKVTIPELIYWWIFRIIIISPVLFNLPSTHENIKLQVTTNFCATFLWEIFQFLPKKFVLSHLSPNFQKFTIFQLFLTSFLGAYLDFYYSLWWWDSFIHMIGGGLLVAIGYEIFTAMQIKYKAVVHLAIIVFGSFCFSFLLGDIWEIFEFLFDQFTGSDSQHWDMTRAVADYSIFKYSDARFPIMDTMIDMICNTVGAFIFAIFLRIRPYYHRGKNNINDKLSK